MPAMLWAFKRNISVILYQLMRVTFRAEEWIIRCADNEAWNRNILDKRNGTALVVIIQSILKPMNWPCEMIVKLSECFDLFHASSIELAHHLCFIDYFLSK